MRHGGRPSQITKDQAELLRRLWMAGVPIKEIQRVIGLSGYAIQRRAATAGLPSLEQIRRATVQRIVEQHSAELRANRARIVYSDNHPYQNGEA